MARPYVWDHGSDEDYNLVMPSVQVLDDQEVCNVLYGPDGEIISYMVTKRKLPIGYQKEVKE